MEQKIDFLVIGAGIIGVNIAIELKTRYPKRKISITEKESEAGLHASGRNSGVLHAGFYYTADTLKAKWTLQGNQEWQSYCKERKLSLNACGKLVVMEREEQLPQLDELLKRGQKNGTPLTKVTAKEAKEIEPQIKTKDWALYSPSTATIDPLEVLRHRVNDAKNLGVQILYGYEYHKRTLESVSFKNGESISAGYVINAAGLYADVVAKDYSFGLDYGMLPYKGVYLYGNQPAHYLKTHVYPLPNIDYPFLGVHFTVQVDGKIKIGPTAMPAFWREQYKGLDSFKWNEFYSISLRHLNLYLNSSPIFKKMARGELNKIRSSVLARQASALVKGVRPEDFTRWGKSGIRAQLVDLKKKKLVMDFVIEGDKRSMHVLNAVSPGFTCALPFARFVCDKVLEELV